MVANQNLKSHGALTQCLSVHSTDSNDTFCIYVSSQRQAKSDWKHSSITTLKEFSPHSYTLASCSVGISLNTILHKIITSFFFCFVRRLQTYMHVINNAYAADQFNTYIAARDPHTFMPTHYTVRHAHSHYKAIWTYWCVAYLNMVGVFRCVKGMFGCGFIIQLNVEWNWLSVSMYIQYSPGDCRELRELVFLYKILTLTTSSTITNCAFYKPISMY